MTDAPTPRETADHAELARIEDVADWFESGDPGANGSVLLSASVVAEHASDLRFILSEIAALRGERDRLKLAICGGEDVPGAIDAVTVEDCEGFIREERQRHDGLLTQAKRQRDELRKALERIATVDMGGGFLGALACRRVASEALANQGAD